MRSKMTDTDQTKFIIMAKFLNPQIHLKSMLTACARQ